MKPIFLSLGLLFSLCTVACAAPTPAVTVVQKFIDARNAQNYAAAYALLSHDTTQTIPFSDFKTSITFTPDMLPAGMPPAVSALAAFFGDFRNLNGYSFTVVSTGPALPNTVLVKAISSKDTQGLAATIKIVVVTDPLDKSHLKLDLLQSFRATDPMAFDKMERESNLIQIALGVIQYTQDHDEHLPDADKWVDEILPYVKNEAVFHDPSAPASQKWNYAFNKNLSGKPLAQLDIPADTVMLFESTLGVKNASDTGQSVPVPGRHLGGTDYALADGHVKWYTDGTKLSYLLSGK